MRGTEVDALISPQCSALHSTTFPLLFLLQIVFYMMPTTFNHHFNTTIPRFECILNSNLIKITLHLSCNALQSFNGSRLSVERVPFEQTIRTEIHNCTVCRIPHPIFFPNKINPQFFSQSWVFRAACAGALY